MRVLGIDPGFGRTGVAVIERSGVKDFVVFSVCLETDPKSPFPKRLGQIISGIKKIIIEWKPDRAAIEKLYFTSNQKTAMQVAEARGAIISILNEMGLPIGEYTPLQVKSAITGNGFASKTQVANMLGKLSVISNKIKRDDEYDAIAIALTDLSTPKYEKD